MLFKQILAVAGLSRRKFSLSLVESQSLLEDASFPEGMLGTILPEVKGELAPIDDDFHAMYYRRVFRSLKKMDANIESRLDSDQRWSAFLLKVPAGYFSQTHYRKSSFIDAKRNARKLISKKAVYDASTKSKVDEMLMHPFIGMYQGSISSTPAVIVFTAFRGNFEGRYMLADREDSDKVYGFGEIGNCHPAAARELLCVWRDRDGFGALSLLFNDDATEFRGTRDWYSPGRSSSVRMEKKWWDDPRMKPDGWTGVLIR
jgi:hypothetical protein